MKFRTDALLKAYEDVAFGTKEWNEKIAKLYIGRVNVLKAAKDGHELLVSHVYRFKALKKGTALAGWYSMNLDGFWRLLVSFEDDKRTIAVVEEVSKHYGD